MNGPTNPSDRQLWETFSSGLPVHSVSSCPDPLALAAWLDGRMDATAVEAIDDHLVTCGPCRATIAEARLALDDEAMQLVPPAVLEAAKGLVEATPLIVTTERARRWSMPVQSIGRWAVAAVAGIVVCLIGYQAGSVTVRPTSGPAADVISEMTFGVFDDANGTSTEWDALAGQEVAG